MIGVSKDQVSRDAFLINDSGPLSHALVVSATLYCVSLYAFHVSINMYMYLLLSLCLSLAPLLFQCAGVGTLVRTLSLRYIIYHCSLTAYAKENAKEKRQPISMQTAMSPRTSLSVSSGSQPSVRPVAATTCGRTRNWSATRTVVALHVSANQRHRLRKRHSKDIEIELNAMCLQPVTPTMALMLSSFRSGACAAISFSKV